MTMCVSTIAIVLAFVLLPAAWGRPQYQAQIPNGANVMYNGVPWPGVGHVGSAGGGARNQFGMDFLSSGPSWATLCPMDSDGDGYTNGAELGDPGCTWTPGATPSRTTDITHPAFADSFPGASTPQPATPTPIPQSAANRELLRPGETGIATGYLMDVPSPLMEQYQLRPESYTVQMAVTAISSGRNFSLLVRRDNTTERYTPYYNLSYAATMQVVQYVNQRRSIHRNHGFLRVNAAGTVQSSAPFLFDTTQIWSAEVTIEGYIADIFCVDLVIALDGANMITEPEKHTKHCAALARCIPGGYSILVKPPAGVTDRYGPMYNLTTAGNRLALEWLRTLPERQADLLIRGTGVLTPDGRFEMTSISGPAPILPLWAIIVIALVCLLAVAAIIGGLCCWMRSKRSPTKEAPDAADSKVLVAPEEKPASGDGKANPLN